MDQPTAKIHRGDLRALVDATRLGTAEAVPLLDVAPEAALPAKPPPVRIPLHPVRVLIAFAIGIVAGFTATLLMW